MQEVPVPYQAPVQAIPLVRTGSSLKLNRRSVPATLRAQWAMGRLQGGFISSKYELGWWAFTRLDQVLDQEKHGVFKTVLRAGLRHVLVGVERPSEDSLGWLNKHGYGYNIAKEDFGIMRDKYPEVFRKGTFITGVRSDSAESIRNLLSYAHEVDVDFAAGPSAAAVSKVAVSAPVNVTVAWPSLASSSP